MFKLSKPSALTFAFISSYFIFDKNTQRARRCLNAKIQFAKFLACELIEEKDNPKKKKKKRQGTKNGRFVKRVDAMVVST